MHSSPSGSMPLAASRAADQRKTPRSFLRGVQLDLVKRSLVQTEAGRELDAGARLNCLDRPRRQTPRAYSLEHPFPKASAHGAFLNDPAIQKATLRVKPAIHLRPSGAGHIGRLVMACASGSAKADHGGEDDGHAGNTIHGSLLRRVENHARSRPRAERRKTPRSFLRGVQLDLERDP